MTTKSGLLKRVLIAGGLTFAAAGLAMNPAPAAARAFVSVGIGLPGFVAPPPVVYAPPPMAYAPPPPVVYPPPVAYVAPGYYYGGPAYGHVGVVYGPHRWWR